MENYSFFRSQTGIYLNVCLTASYHFPSDKPLRPAIFRALAVAVRKYPILSAVPVDEKKPRFIRLDVINLERTVTFLEYHGDAPVPGDEALDEVLEQQHNLPFTHEESLGPFWRVCVLHSLLKSQVMTLCFCFHHSLADTKSALVFHQDLEHALSFPSTYDIATTIAANKGPLLPSLEGVIDLKTTDQYIRKMENMGEPPSSTWSGEVQTLPVHTRFSSVCIPSPALKGLVAQSKWQGASMTALLMASAARAFFDVLPAQYTSLSGDCAVSLRPFLPLPVTDNSIGCYVGSFSESYSRDNASIWDDARRTKRGVDQVRRNNGADMPVGLLGGVADMKLWLLDKIGKKRWAAWELSNIGAVESDGTAGRCRMQSVLFSQSASACSGVVKISAVTGRDGRMALGFSWQRGVVGDEIARGVMERMREIMMEIAGEV